MKTKWNNYVYLLLLSAIFLVVVNCQGGGGGFGGGGACYNVPLTFGSTYQSSHDKKEEKSSKLKDILKKNLDDLESEGIDNEDENSKDSINLDKAEF